MSDIFISYSSLDKPKAKLLADALAQHGWSVWWDRNIPPGSSFDEVIDKALDSARCVIVLWSKSSISSNYVKAEAAEGAKRQILIPVLIEDVKIPLEFRRIQAAILSDWADLSHHHGFSDLLKVISEKITGISGVDGGEQYLDIEEDTLANPLNNEEMSPGDFFVVNSLNEVLTLSKKNRVILFTYKAEPLLGNLLTMTMLKRKVIYAIMTQAKAKGVVICVGNMEKGWLSLRSDLGKQLKIHNISYEGCSLFQDERLIISERTSGLRECALAAERMIQGIN